MNLGWILVASFIIGIIAVVIIGICALLFLHVDVTPSSDGTMSDTVYSVEKSGLFWKRWEISFTNEHDMIYCTRNEEIAKTLKEALKKREKVTVSFSDEMMVWDWDCSSNTIINIVEGMI